MARRGPDGLDLVEGLKMRLERKSGVTSRLLAPSRPLQEASSETEPIQSLDGYMPEYTIQIVQKYMDFMDRDCMQHFRVNKRAEK